MLLYVRQKCAPRFFSTIRPLTSLRHTTMATTTAAAKSKRPPPTRTTTRMKKKDDADELAQRLETKLKISEPTTTKPRRAAPAASSSKTRIPKPAATETNVSDKQLKDAMGAVNTVLQHLTTAVECKWTVSEAKREEDADAVSTTAALAVSARSSLKTIRKGGDGSARIDVEKAALGVLAKLVQTEMASFVLALVGSTADCSPSVQRSRRYCARHEEAPLFTHWLFTRRQYIDRRTKHAVTPTAKSADTLEWFATGRAISNDCDCVSSTYLCHCNSTTCNGTYETLSLS